MSKKHNTINRRKFLGQASCAAVGATTLFSGLVNMKALNAAAISNSSVYRVKNDYKALVCIFLAGGNDSYNMLVPRGQNEYQQYATTRSNLALAQNSLLPISPKTSDGREYGLHPSMPNMQRYFNEGRAAFVSNVGTLIEKIPSADGFYSRGFKVPLGLYSHADQAAHWQTAVPQSRGALGWGGRMADLIQDMNENTSISLNISLSGNNIFQNGKVVVPYSIERDGSGSIGIQGYEEQEFFGNLLRSSVDNLMDYHYQDMFKNAYANTVKSAQANHLVFSSAIQNLAPLQTTFSTNNLSRGLNMVAKTIAIRDQLNVNRQCFFIEYGGWDHHDEVLLIQGEMLAELDLAISEFQNSLVEMGLEDQVTTFTISDFARTLTSNGNGTDHGWGGNAMVLGGAVNGGDMYGNYPQLTLENGLELGSGVYVPTTSADEYFAELALWFGVSPTDLDTVLPNIRNFYSPDPVARPLGFMKS